MEIERKFTIVHCATASEYLGKQRTQLVVDPAELRTYRWSQVVRIPDAPRIASIAWIILYCCMPLFVFKQVVNCIQLKDAANILVALDMKEK